MFTHSSRSPACEALLTSTTPRLVRLFNASVRRDGEATGQGADTSAVQAVQQPAPAAGTAAGSAIGEESLPDQAVDAAGQAAAPLPVEGEIFVEEWRARPRRLHTVGHEILRQLNEWFESSRYGPFGSPGRSDDPDAGPPPAPGAPQVTALVNSGGNNDDDNKGAAVACAEVASDGNAAAADALQAAESTAVAEPAWNSDWRVHRPATPPSRTP